jgi:predicted dehydrogenase
LLQDFLEAIERGEQPSVTGEAALDVQLLIEVILRSGTSRRAEPVA